VGLGVKVAVGRGVPVGNGVAEDSEVSVGMGTDVGEEQEAMKNKTKNAENRAQGTMDRDMEGILNHKPANHCSIGIGIATPRFPLLRCKCLYN